MMKINNFRGELSDISAKKEALDETPRENVTQLMRSAIPRSIFRTTFNPKSDF